MERFIVCRLLAGNNQSLIVPSPGHRHGTPGALRLRHILLKNLSAMLIEGSDAMAKPPQASLLAAAVYGRTDACAIGSRRACCLSAASGHI